MGTTAFQQKVLEQLAAILARLDDIEARLARIEAQGPAADGKAARKAGGKGAAAAE
jgi:hypothetical protein